MTDREPPFEHDLIEEITRRVLEKLRADDAPLVAGASYGAPFGDEGRCDICNVWGTCSEKCPTVFRAFVDCGACRISARPGLVRHPKDLAPFIDHTLLKPDATKDQVEALCREARENCFASVCVNGVWVPLARELLRGSGSHRLHGRRLSSRRDACPTSKAYETRRAVHDGAQEIDMVIKVGALKSGDYALVERDIRGVVEAAGRHAVVKVILETALLTRDEKIEGVHAREGGGRGLREDVDRLRGGGATVEDVRSCARSSDESMGVKAAGGIRDSGDGDRDDRSGRDAHRRERKRRDRAVRRRGR